MAEAKNLTKTVKVEVEQVVNDGVELKLSIEEAATLKLILVNIGGNPWETLRFHADKVSSALTGVLPAKFINLLHSIGSEGFFSETSWNGPGLYFNEDSRETLKEWGINEEG